MVTQVKESVNTIAFPEEKASRARARRLRTEVDEHTSLRLDVAQLLQSTLDLPTVMNFFFESVKREMPLGSLTYRHEKLAADIDLGKSGAHSCHYSLVSDQNNLGELVFTRTKRFAEKELQMLEMLIGWLLSPLRNALMYREALQHALRDPLTGAGNRIALESSLEREMALAKRHQHPVALLVLDIDFFKKVNDTYGHSAGDCVLKDVARLMRNSCRKTDAVFRYGGEEFVVLLNQTDTEGAHIIAERLRQSIEGMTTTYNDIAINVTISIGVASMCGFDTVNTLFERGDRALYQAKKQRNNVVFLPVENNATTLKL
jgi:diguanylate cyclase (GGDEF)-like protein